MKLLQRLISMIVVSFSPIQGNQIVYSKLSHFLLILFKIRYLFPLQRLLLHDHVVRRYLRRPRDQTRDFGGPDSQSHRRESTEFDGYQTETFCEESPRCDCGDIR